MKTYHQKEHTDDTGVVNYNVSITPYGHVVFEWAGDTGQRINSYECHPGGGIGQLRLMGGWQRCLACWQ